MAPARQRMAEGCSARRGALAAAALLRLASGAHGGQRGGGAAAPAAPAAGEAHPPLRMREALLREARERLTTWYEDKASLDLPFWRDGAQVQMSKGECLCDGPGDTGKVPLTFGKFDVSGARPVDIFNVLADVDKALEWDTTISQINDIAGAWPKTDGVRGLELEYPTGIFLVPPREVYEWVAYSADHKRQEYWVVYSTLNNSRLQKVLPPKDGTLPAQNCLGGYWIRPRAQGGAHVLFTQHVNPHPPMLLSAKLVFTVSWGKQIDYINILRQRAQEQAKLHWAGNRTVVSEELLRELPAGERPAESGDATGRAFRVIDQGFFRLFGEARPSMASPGRRSWVEPLAVVSTLCGACVAAIAAGVAVARGRRRALASGTARRAALPRASGAAAAPAAGAAEAAALLQEQPPNEFIQV